MTKNKTEAIVSFYGEGGTRLLSSGGDDRALRVFSAIQDQQSLELSQSHVERRAKRLKITETALKLPPIAQGKYFPLTTFRRLIAHARLTFLFYNLSRALRNA